jgi:hypothetical protein
VLGWAGFLDGHGGWGRVQPMRISNQGDDSSFVYQVHWRSWGAPVAYGIGKRHAFKRAGGNYRYGVLDELRATNLGPCHGTLAYRTLYSRQARRPGTAAFGKWEGWSPRHGMVCGRFDELMVRVGRSDVDGGSCITSLRRTSIQYPGIAWSAAAPAGSPLTGVVTKRRSCSHRRTRLLRRCRVERPVRARTVVE